MKVSELKMGDKITQCIENSIIAFEVMAVKQIGRRFVVTFNSAFGTETASYQGDACIPTA
ncbi:hypothetical protein [uncultured Aquitalea sp.]|uniref:hypothetical protein n=1 Tax=uncultured Aquitalea sp. TaxID=540272 RepID=UPI0025F35F71|nr:hypothetical protein [uncultured Aquitalea sp.]